MVAVEVVNDRGQNPSIGQHTQPKRKHIWQRSGSIVDDMELTGLEQYVPYGCAFAESFPSTVRIIRQRNSIEASQDSAHCWMVLVSFNAAFFGRTCQIQ